MDFVPPEPKKANKDILEHNRKRQIEVKIFQLVEDMEDRGHTAAEIEKKTSKLRERLEQEAEVSRSTDRPTETHDIAERKQEEIKRLKEAFGLTDTFVPGEAFDQDLQEERKVERMKKFEERARLERKAARAEKRRLKKERKKEKRHLKKEKKARKKAAKRQKRAQKSEDQDSEAAPEKSPKKSPRRRSPSESGSSSSSSSD